MLTVKKTKGTALPMPMGVMLGVITGLFLTAALAAALAWAVLDGKISEKILGYLVMGVLLVASFLGAVTAAEKIKRRRMLVCCVTGTIYYLSLLVTTAIFFGGKYQGAVTAGVVVLIGSLLSGVIGLRKKGGKDSYRKYCPC